MNATKESAAVQIHAANKGLEFLCPPIGVSELGSATNPLGDPAAETVNKE